MAHVIIRSYNTFFDHATGVQFNPVLEKGSGLYIGLADVPDNLIAPFKANPAYQVISDDELASITTGRLFLKSGTQEKVPFETATLSGDYIEAAPRAPK